MEYIVKYVDGLSVDAVSSTPPETTFSDAVSRHAGVSIPESLSADMAGVAITVAMTRAIICNSFFIDSVLLGKYSQFLGDLQKCYSLLTFFVDDVIDINRLPVVPEYCAIILIILNGLYFFINLHYEEDFFQTGCCIGVSGADGGM